MKRRKFKIYSKVEIPTSPNESVNLENLNIRQVVADVLFTDPSSEISLSDAKKIKSDVEIGDSFVSAGSIESVNYLVYHKHHGIYTQIVPNLLHKEKKDLYITPQDIDNSLFWTKKKICLKKGWTDFTFMYFDLSPDKTDGETQYYKIAIINQIENSPDFQEYLKTVNNLQKMLIWVQHINLTKWEFLDAFVFTIPEMPKEALIINACYSYNDYIDRKSSNNGGWYYGEWFGLKHADPDNDDEKIMADICRNYLRHEHTPYEYIMQIFRDRYETDSEAFHDKLKDKINSAIIKVYPWLDTYHKKYFRL